MKAHGCRLSWLLIVSGFVLLAALGHLSLAVLLIPVSLVIGCGLLWLGRKLDGVGTGLK